MIRLGLVGAGFIGKVHAQCILIEPRASLSKVFDVDEKAAKNIAEGTGSSVADTLEEILLDNTIDAIIIASSTTTHGVIARAASKNRKPFLCEKPLDNSLNSAIETAGLVKESGVFGGIAFNRRYDRQHHLLREAISKGELGKLEMMHFTSRSQSPPTIEYAKKSGGLLRDKGTHFFDLACWMAQDRPEKVYAIGKSLIDPRLAEIGDYDTAMIVLEFSRGTLCHFDFSRRTSYGYDERIEIFGSKGRIDSGAPKPLEIVGYFGENIRQAGLHQSWFDRVEPTYKMQLSAFVDVLQGNQNGFPDVNDGLIAEAIADAAYKSALSGSAVKVFYAP